MQRFRQRAVHSAPLIRRLRSPQTKGVVSPQLLVPAEIPPPPYARTGRVPQDLPGPEIHTATGISHMRAAGLAAAELLEFAGTLVVPGCTGDDIDRLFHEEVLRRRLYPSPLNYAGFPKSICVSVNEVVCHGIPDSSELERGDLVKLDVSVFLNGCHGDTCRTFVAGGLEAADERAQALLEVTKRSLNTAIGVCGPGVPVSAIGDVIHPLLEERGFAPVREYAGHGIGSTFHTLPLVWHFRGPEFDPALRRPPSAACAARGHDFHDRAHGGRGRPPNHTVAGWLDRRDS